MSEKAMTKEEYFRSTPTGLSITHDNDTYSLFIYVPNISETVLYGTLVWFIVSLNRAKVVTQGTFHLWVAN